MDQVDNNEANSQPCLQKKSKVDDGTNELCESNNCYINMLYDDCLAQIFMYVPIEERLQLQRVCKKWKRASKLAWSDVKKLDYSYEALGFHKYERVSDEVIRRLLDMIPLFKLCGSFVHELNLTGINNSFILPMIKDYFPNVTNLKLACTTNKDKDFINLFSNMPKLRSLSIEWSIDCEKDVPHSFIEAFGDVADTLEELEFLNCPILEQTTFIRFMKPVLEKFKSLTSFSLYNFKLDPSVLGIIYQNNTLVKLSLSASENFNITGNDLIIPYLKNFKYLDVSGIEITDDNFLINLAKNCPELISFTFHCETPISDMGIIPFSELKKLESFIMNKETFNENTVTDHSITQFKNMKNFSCFGNKSITDFSIIPVLKNSPELETLDVAHTSVTSEIVKQAAELTKKRKNGITLTIHLSRKNFVEELFQRPDLLETPDYLSPLLKLEYHEG